jgi:hypothetical protein
MNDRSDLERATLEYGEILARRRRVLRVLLAEEPAGVWG